MSSGYHPQAGPQGSAVYLNGCRGKQHYPSKSFARAKIQQAIAHGHPDDGTLNAYKCKACKSWHIGHKPGTKRIRAEQA